MREALERDPDAWQGAVQRRVLRGARRRDRTRRSSICAQAVERTRDEVKQYAPDDSDLDSIRADPRYAELMA